MPEIDEFALTLLEEAKRFYERAKEAAGDDARNAFLHAAILLAVCALEAHVNSISLDFVDRGDVLLHERGLLLEKDIRLNNGQFVLTDSLRMARLEDRIEFLHFRFGGVPLDRQGPWWPRLSEALALRNKLTHAKDAVAITIEATGRAITAVLDALNALYTAIYKRAFPTSGMGLDSRLSF